MTKLRQLRGIPTVLVAIMTVLTTLVASSDRAWAGCQFSKQVDQIGSSLANGTTNVSGTICGVSFALTLPTPYEQGTGAFRALAGATTATGTFDGVPITVTSSVPFGQGAGPAEHAFILNIAASGITVNGKSLSVTESGGPSSGIYTASVNGVTVFQGYYRAYPVFAQATIC